MMLKFQQIEDTVKKEVGGIGVKACRKYLSERGITDAISDKYSIFFYSSQSIIGWDDNRLAIVFPYHNTRGEQTGYWTARLVDPNLIPASGFAALRQRKRGKLYAPAGETPQPYFTPSANWRNIPDGSTIYFCESVIKALVVGHYGQKYAIGLNGVWGYSSKKSDQPILAGIQALPWEKKHLKAVVLYDSNVDTNHDVQAAISEFASRMLRYCKNTRPRMLRLDAPPNGEEQWGIDDAFQELGPEWFHDFLDGPTYEIEVDPVQLAVARLNDEVCFVRKGSFIAEVDNGNILSVNQFEKGNYANRVVWTMGEHPKRIYIAKEWKESNVRRTVAEVGYSPGDDIYFKEDGVEKFNMWRDDGVGAVEGNVHPWLDLIENNIPDPELRHWIISWFAYGIQNPGVKILSCIFIYGDPGVGKNRLLDPFRAIYGRNCIFISNDELESKFNASYAAKQFVVANELMRTRESSKINRILKVLITEPKLPFHAKGKDPVDIYNHINFVAISNDTDAMPIDEKDRRMCVIKMENIKDHTDDRIYWRAFDEWLKGGGPSALRWYLESYDVGEFDPAAYPPETAYKEEVREEGRTALEQFCHELPGNLPPVYDDRSVFTAMELGIVFYKRLELEISESQCKSLGHALKRMGYKQAHGGLPIKAGQRKLARYWVIREVTNEWDYTEVQNHLKGWDKKHPAGAGCKF